MLNLSDTPDKLKNYEGYADSYYANSTKHIEVGMKPNYGTPEFNAALAK